MHSSGQGVSIDVSKDNFCSVGNKLATSIAQGGIHYNSPLLGEKVSSLDADAMGSTVQSRDHNCLAINAMDPLMKFFWLNGNVHNERREWEKGKEGS